MENSKEIKIKLASREWQRQFYTGVVRSFAKTITEPITNSDTSYKRKYSLSHSSGFIDMALRLEKGNKFDSSEIKKNLKGKSPERFIEIHLYTAKGHGKTVRTCDIVDFAEGLSTEDVEKIFSEFAADKSEVSKGQPGRSLFGRGVSDVLLGHNSGKFISVYDGILSFTDFVFDHKKDGEPKLKIFVNNKPSKSMLNEYHLSKEKNGSCVSVILHDDCRIPDEGTFIQILSQFYMLRLINFDPNVKIKVIRYRSGGKVLEDILDYDFPFGDIIEKLSFEIRNPLNDLSLPNLKIDSIICRVEGNSKLPGREAGEQRANGLLIVDDKDAVLDLTFLPQYELVPYLSNLFGIVRITNIREYFSWYLNNGKDSPLTVTRDGFDGKHEFSKMLFQELSKYLEPIYKREEERFKKTSTAEVSHETREKINDAIKELNRYLKQLGEGAGPGDTPPPPPTDIKDFQFIPEQTKPVIDQERYVRLYVKKGLLKPTTEIIFDSSNPRINVYPLAYKIEEGKKHEDHLFFTLMVKSDALHESGTITALAESNSGLLETKLEIVDVIAQTVVVPPEEMEFRPKDSRGQPNKQNNITLFINPNQIPVGRKIKLGVIKQHGTMGFFEKGDIVNSINVTFDRQYLKDNIGRIPIDWRASGWNQQAKVFAETKRPNGELVHIEGRLLTEQEPEDGGMIKDWRYTDEIEDHRCSDLTNGILYINSKHALNNKVFGTKEEFKQRMDDDRTAQYRFTSLLVEQSVYSIAERSVINNKLMIDPNAPITSLRQFIDKKTNELSPKILKILVTKK